MTKKSSLKKIEIKEHLTHRDRIGLIRCIGNDSKRVKRYKKYS